MIKIKLSILLGERRMTQLELSRKTGIRPNSIGLLYNELTDNVKLSHLDSICKVLNCDISDLLEYKADK